MVSLGDLGRRGAITVLAALGAGEPLTMKEFTEASGIVPDRAKLLREDLVLMGLIKDTIVRKQGASERHEITLTPLGRQVAKHLLAVDDALRSAHGGERRDRGKSKA